MDTITLVGETDIRKVLSDMASAPEKQHAADVEEARKVMHATKMAPPYDAAAVTAFDVDEITAAPVEVTVSSVLAPAPLDIISDGDQLAPYTEYKPATVEVNAAEYDIRVKEHIDTCGRKFYEFDDGRSKSLLACVFETTAGQLIALNGIVMPLTAFQKIVYVRTASAKLAKLATARTTGDSRAPVPVSSEKVLCTMADGKEIMLVNTTVQHVMMALQLLAPPANRVETEQDEHVGPLRRLWRWLY